MEQQPSKKSNEHGISENKTDKFKNATHASRSLHSSRTQPLRNITNTNTDTENKLKQKVICNKESVSILQCIEDFEKTCKAPSNLNTVSVQGFTKYYNQLEKKSKAITTALLLKIKPSPDTNLASYNCQVISQTLTNAYLLLFQTPLIAFHSAKDAEESIKLSQRIHNKLHQLDPHLSINKARDHTNDYFDTELTKLTIELINLLRKAHKQLKETYKKAITGIGIHLSQRIISHSIQKKHIENNPESQARELHTLLENKIEQDLCEIHLHTTPTHHQILQSQLNEIEETLALDAIITRLEKTHEAALNPRTLLRQYKQDNYSELKYTLCIEITENKSLKNLYKSLGYLRSEIIDLLPEQKKLAILNQINVARIIGLIAQQDTTTINHIKETFHYIYQELEQHTNISLSDFKQHALSIMNNCTHFNLLAATLPELLTHTFNMIKHIERERIYSALDTRPLVIQNDMIKLEKKIFHNKVNEYTITLNQTQQWIQHLFDTADKNQLNDHNCYSKSGYQHIFNLGLYQLMMQNYIDRSILPETLFMDYRRIRNMQNSRQRMIRKLATYQTIIAHPHINTSPKFRQVIIPLQEVINQSDAHAPKDDSLFTQAISTWINQTGILSFLPHITLRDDIIPLVHKHIKPSHPVSQILHKRVNHIIRTSINTACFNPVLFKIVNIETLYHQFMLNFSTELKTLITNHLTIHKEFYQKEIHQAKINQFTNRITHQANLPNENLKPCIGSHQQYQLLSLRLNNIALIATCMSLTVQHVNQTKTAPSEKITDQDIANHIKQTGAHILFKQRGYSKAQIINHIKEYNQLPLLQTMKLNLHKVYAVFKQAAIIKHISDTEPSNICKKYISWLPTLLKEHHIDHHQETLKLLTTRIHQLIGGAHPGFRIYQSALRDILRIFLIQRKSRMALNKKWAALSHFRDEIQITHSLALKLWRAIHKEAEEKADHLQLLPSSIKSGLR